MLVAFCCYASISVKFDNAGIRHIGPSFLTLFYFLLLITEILYLTVYFVPKLKALFYRGTAWMILAMMNVLFVCLVLIGYIILSVQFEGVVGRAYFVGFGLFIFANGCGIVCDVSMNGFIKESLHGIDEDDEFEDVEYGVVSSCMQNENVDRQNLEDYL